MILITGATGHIGNVLVRHLSNKNIPLRLLIPSKEDVSTLHGITAEIFNCDIRDSEKVKEAIKGCSVVYHLAGMIQIDNVNKQLLYDVNVNGTKNVIEGCLEHNAKLIYVSSVHAFVENDYIDEHTKIIVDEIIGDYGKSKAQATLQVRKAMNEGLDGVIVYPSGVIGPFDFKLSEMGKVLLYIIKNNNKKRLYCFDGEYDFVDVRDVVNGLINVWVKDIKNSEFILSGHKISIEKIYDHARELLNGNFKTIKVNKGLIKIIAKLGSIYSKIFNKKTLLNKYSIHVLTTVANFNNNKAKNELGYQPRCLKESLYDSINWLMDYKQKSIFKLKKYKMI